MIPASILICKGWSVSKGLIRPLANTEKTVSAIVQERIRQAILSGALPAGSRIDQNGLASSLSVSLVPVREALKALEAEGFVQIVPRRGAFVTKTSPDDMTDLYFAREVLEGQAAYHAAKRLTDEELRTLQALMPQMDDALHRHDYNHFTEFNRQFHFTIYRAAGSRYLLDSIDTLWVLAERYRYRYLFLQERGAIIQAEHQAILDAACDHSPERLRDSIVNHMRQTLVGIRRYLILPDTADNAPDTADE